MPKLEINSVFQIKEAPDPLISIIIPCYNMGRFLPETLNSAFSQTYQPLEIIIVDDGSHDSHTLTVLTNLERDKRVKVLRQPNRGPGAARNYAISQSKGRYIYPLDADDLLARDAIELLYRQIAKAPPNVKFIYINQQFFGNRSDYAEQPNYNLYALMQNNYISVSSLLDRSVFEEGFKFREDIGLGHEDWEFFLQLAEHGYIGQPSPHKVFFYRKTGFSRSDSVVFNYGDFLDQVAAHHPNLYSPSKLLEVKKQWSPALSVLLDWEESADLVELNAFLERQTCQDFEIVKLEAAIQQNGKKLSRTERVSRLLQQAKGKFLFLWAHPIVSPFADKTFIEKALRSIDENYTSHCIVLLATQPEQPYFAWRMFKAEELTSELKQQCLGMLLRSDVFYDKLPEVKLHEDENVYAAIIGTLPEITNSEVHWRTIKLSETIVLDVNQVRPSRLRNVLAKATTEEALPKVTLIDLARFRQDKAFANEFRLRISNAPKYLNESQIVRNPALAPQEKATTAQLFYHRPWLNWHPEGTKALMVLRHKTTNGRILSTNGGVPGFEVESHLGFVFFETIPGSSALLQVTRENTVLSGGDCYRLPAPLDEIPPHKSGKKPTLLGYISDVCFPGMVELAQMIDSENGQRIFTTDVNEKMQQGFYLEAFLGYIEPIRLEPFAIRVAKTETIRQAKSTWAIYEAFEPTNQTYFYTTHPDFILGKIYQARQVLGKLSVAPEQGHLAVYQLYNPDSGKYNYSAHLNEGVEQGFQLQGLLGYISEVEKPDYILLQRYYNTVVEYHRLSKTNYWEWRKEFSCDGPLGWVAPPSSHKVPLYRWRTAEGDFTYSAGFEAVSDDWILEGVLGLVASHNLRQPDLSPFYQLKHPASGRLAYASEPAGFTELGYEIAKPLAYWQTYPNNRNVPVYRLYSYEYNRHLYALNPQEKEGYVNEGVFGYVDPAVPPLDPTQFIQELPALKRIQLVEPKTNQVVLDGLVYTEAHPGTVPLYKSLTPGGTFFSVNPQNDDSNTAPEIVGYVAMVTAPGSLPLYRLRHIKTGQWLHTTNPDLVGQDNYAIDCVVGYLRGAGYQEPAIEAVSDKADEFAAITDRHEASLEPLKQRIQFLESQEAELKGLLDRYQMDLRALQQTRTVQTARTLGLVAGKVKTLAGSGNAIKGALDLPVTKAAIEGSIEIAGWTFSDEAPIIKITVLVGGQVLGEATYGVPRPDVEVSYRNKTDGKCGFNVTFATASLAKGTTELVIRIQDTKGNQRDFKRLIVLV